MLSKNSTNIKVREDIKDIVGLKQGYLTIIGVPFVLHLETYKTKKSGRKDKKSWVVVQCECGNCEIRYLGHIYCQKTNTIRVGKQLNSCRACFKYSNYKHGCSNGLRKGSPAIYNKLYQAWCAMKARVKNPYKHAIYLEKGIKVCEEWLNDFQAFYDWSMANGYYEQPKHTPHKDRLSLDRIDSDKDYCPENCRWITCSENSKKVGSSNFGKKSFMRRKIKYLESLLKENNIQQRTDDELAIQFENDRIKTRKKNQAYKPTAKRNSSTL